MKKIKGIDFVGENEGKGYSEYFVKKAPDKACKIKQLLLIALYIAFVGAYIFVFTVLTKIIYAIAILPLFFWILWFFTWKLTKAEYAYITHKGIFYIYYINGYGKAKEVLKTKISEADIFAPFEFLEEYKNVDDIKEKNYASSMTSENLYFVKIQNDIYYFDGSNKLVSSLKYYSSAKVVQVELNR